MAAAVGAMKRHGRKQNAVAIAVTPVRPPMRMPAMLSAYAVPGELPKSAEATIATASTIKPRRRLFGLPLASRRLPAWATPMKVDSESNRQVIRTVTIAGTIVHCNAPTISSCRNEEEKSGALTHDAGATTQPPAHAAIVTTM